jgi:hypothetical protein
MLTPRFANLFDDSQGNLGNLRKHFGGFYHGKRSINDAGMAGSDLSSAFVLGQDLEPVLRWRLPIYLRSADDTRFRARMAW